MPTGQLALPGLGQMALPLAERTQGAYRNPQTGRFAKRPPNLAWDIGAQMELGLTGGSRGAARGVQMDLMARKAGIGWGAEMTSMMDELAARQINPGGNAFVGPPAPATKAAKPYTLWGGKGIRAGFNRWAMRHPIGGFLALGGMALGAAGLVGGAGAIGGGIVGGGIGAGLGYLGSRGTLGKTIGGLKAMGGGGRAAAFRLGKWGALAGALLGASLNSNRPVNRIRGMQRPRIM